MAVGESGDQSSFGNSLFALCRYNSNGELDSTFGINGKVLTSIRTISDAAFSVGIQLDGKIVLAGLSYHYSNNELGPDFAVVRYNSDGSLDTTFGIGGKTVIVAEKFSLATHLIILDSNKILISGSTYNGSNWSFGLAQLKSDGSMDQTFGNNGIVTTQIGQGDDYANYSIQQPDKKIGY